MTFDAATDGGNNGGGSTSLTFSHTVTGTDPILFVGFVGDLRAGLGNITSVTYNGVAMDLIIGCNDAGLERWFYLFKAENPATGAHNVVITTPGVQWILGGAVSYAGAKASGQPDTYNRNSSGTPVTSLTSSITPLTDNCWVVLVEHARGAAPTAGAGSTLRTYDAANTTWGLFDSNAAITPPASYSMTTDRASTTFATGHILASFAPVGPAPTGAIVQNIGV